jgi:hypothetical protein
MRPSARLGWFAYTHHADGFRFFQAFPPLFHRLVGLYRKILEKIQHPFYDETQNQIEALHKLLGNEQFTALLAQLEPQAQQIADHALGERMR